MPSRRFVVCVYESAMDNVCNAVAVVCATSFPLKIFAVVEETDGWW